MIKHHVSKGQLLGSIMAVFFLSIVPPCFSEPGSPLSGRMFLAEEKGIIDRAKDAVTKKAQDYFVEKAKRDAKKKAEDTAKAAKKKLEGLKK